MGQALFVKMWANASIPFYTNWFTFPPASLLLTLPGQVAQPLVLPVVVPPRCLPGASSLTSPRPSPW